MESITETVPLELSNLRVRQMAATIAGNHARLAAERKFKEMATKTVTVVSFRPCVGRFRVCSMGKFCLLSNVVYFGCTAWFGCAVSISKKFAVVSCCSWHVKDQRFFLRSSG